MAILLALGLGAAGGTVVLWHVLFEGVTQEQLDREGPPIAPDNAPEPQPAPEPEPQTQTPGAYEPGPADVDRLAALQEALTQAVSNDESAGTLRPTAERFVAKHPRWAQAHLLLAQVCLAQPDLPAATDALERALALQPGLSEVHLLTGTAAVKLGRVAEAVSHYQKAVELDPEAVRPRVHLTEALLRLGRIEPAQAAAEAALELDPYHHHAHAAIASICRKQRRFDPAIHHAQRAIKLTPLGKPRVKLAHQLSLASVLREAGRPEQSLQVLQALPASQRGKIEVLDATAAAWAALGRPDRAAQMFETALAAVPTNWLMAQRAAHWRLEAGDVPAARAHAHALRRLQPEADALRQLETRINELIKDEG